jgi:nucleoid-associated protein YgaU
MAQRAHSRASKSGRSRHRKPNKHVRNLGLATAPLVAAIPMANASSASAATSAWDKLASCESGNNWSINTGNGYYGGLQFADGTWDGAGGEKYASRADLASRAEQIIIAAKVLDDRGWSPWPACSSKMGLGGEERREALATAEAYRQGQSNGDAKPADQKADEKKADEKKAGEDADRVKAESQRNDATKVSTERASRGKHRKAATSDTYVVRSGDTLAAIARDKNVAGGWAKLYKLNRSVIGGNPGLIYPGQRLTLG